MSANKGHENLIPLMERTEEERKEIASKGGKAKAENAKKRKVITDTFTAIMNLEIEEPARQALYTDRQGNKMYIELEGQTLLTYMLADIVYDALNGYGDNQRRARQIILDYIEPLK